MRRALAILAIALALLGSGCFYLGTIVAGVSESQDSGGGSGTVTVTVNRDTTASITSVPRTTGAIQNVLIRVIDPGRDRVTLKLEYRQGPETTPFLVAHLAAVRTITGTAVVEAGAGPLLEDTGEVDTAPGPDGIEYVLEWAFQSDLGPGAQAGVTLRLSVVGTTDEGGGVAFIATNQKIGNERPEVRDLSVAGSSGTLLVSFRLLDSTGDTCRVDPFFRVDGGARQPLTAAAGTTLAAVAASADGVLIDFEWRTLQEPAIGIRRLNAAVELVPIDADGSQGDPVQSSPITIVNNLPAAAAIAGVPTRADAASVPVTFTLADPEDEPTGVTLTWRFEGAGPAPLSGATSGAATPAMSDPTANLGAPRTGQTHLFRWSAATDLGDGRARAVSFLVAPAQPGGVAARTAIFLVGNDAPVVTITPTVPAASGGDVAIRYTLSDSTLDTASVALTIEAAGIPERPATVAGGTTGLETGSLASPAVHQIVWKSAADLPTANALAVTLRLRATDAFPGGSGATALAATAITNAGGGGGPAPLSVASITPAGARPAGGTPVTIVGAGFAPGLTEARIGGSLLAGAVEIIGSTVIRGLAPPGVPGPVNVEIRSGAESVTLAAAFRYGDAPAIAAVAPAEGPLAGGTPLVISGTAFLGATGAAGTTVLVGGAPLVGLVVTDAEVRGATPATSTAGPRSITVTTAEGGASAASAFRYLALPTVASIAPSAGPLAGGTPVTIAGGGFLASSIAVLVGGAPLQERAVLSDGTISGRVPARGSAGPVAVEVTTPGGAATLSASFTYVPLPTIASITPNRGLTTGGTALTIQGNGFVVGATEIRLGGTVLAGAAIAPTSISVTLPPGPAALLDLAVTTTGGAAILAGAFRYVDPVRVDAILPAAGPPGGGTAISIVGAGFLAGETTATIGGMPLGGPAVAGPGVLTGITPARPIGPADVVVTTPLGAATLPGGFSYTDAPVVFAIAPPDGPTGGGTVIDLVGAGFAPGATQVTIGGNALAIATVTATLVRGTVPAASGAPGPRTVLVATARGQASVAAGFRYLGAPLVTSILPPFGPTGGGTLLEVRGAGFLASSVTVTVDGAPLLEQVVASDGTITGRTAPGTAGAKTVRVATPGGFVDVAGGFELFAAPTLASIDRATGSTAGGTPVSVTGTSFSPDTRLFVGGLAASGVVVVSPSHLTALTPPGLVGPASVSVTAAGGSAVLVGAFTYEAPAGGGTNDDLTVTAVSPATGSVRGGTEVVIVGTGFVDGQTSVLLGGAPLDDPSFIAPTLLRGRTAPHAMGPVGVTVTVGAVTATLPGGFTYAPAVSFRLAASALPSEDRSVEIDVVLSTGGPTLPALIVVNAIATSLGSAVVDDFGFSGESSPTIAMSFATGAPDGSVQTIVVFGNPDLDPEANELALIRLAPSLGAVALDPLDTHRVLIPDDDLRVRNLAAAPARVERGASVDLSFTVVAPSLTAVIIEPGTITLDQAATGAQVTPFPALPDAAASSVTYRVSAVPPANFAGESLTTRFARDLGTGDSLQVVDVALALEGGSWVAATYSSGAMTFAGTFFPDPLFSTRSILARCDEAGVPLVATVTARGDPASMLGGGVFYKAIAISPATGELFVAGFYVGEVLFNGLDGTTLTATSPIDQISGDPILDVFIARHAPGGEILQVLTFGGAGFEDQVLDIAALFDGGVAIVGTAIANFQLGGGEPGEFSFTSVGGTPHGFVARFTRELTLVWAQQTINLTDPVDQGERVSRMSAYPDGGIVAAGFFNDDLDIGSKHLHTDAPFRNGFVAAFDPGGSVRWIVQVDGTGGAADDTIDGVVALPDGGAAFAGQTATSLDPSFRTRVIDPDDDQAVTTFRATEHLFVARVDAGGHVVWSADTVGDGTVAPADVLAWPDGAIGVACTAEGNGSITFSPDGGPGVQLSPRGADPLLARYRPDGAIADVIRATDVSPGSEDTDRALQAAALPDGGALLVGEFTTDALRFDAREAPAPADLPNAQNDRRFFLAGYAPVSFALVTVTPTGIAYARGPTTAVTGAESRVSQVAIRPDGDVVAVGAFRRTFTFGPGTMLTSAFGGTQDDVFVARYAPDGTLRWAVAGGGGMADGLGVAALFDGGVIVAGFYGVGAAGPFGLPGATGLFDGFVVRLDGSSGAPIWRVQIASSPGDQSFAKAVAAYVDGSVAVAVNHQGGGPTVVPAAGASNALPPFEAGLLKLGANGSLGSGNTVSANGSDAADAVGVAALPDGRAVLALNFTGSLPVTIEAGPGPSPTLVATGVDTAFLIAEPGVGSTAFESALQLDAGTGQSGGSEETTALAPIGSSRFVVTGRFTGTLGVDGDRTIGSTAGMDGFYLEIDADGATTVTGTSLGGNLAEPRAIAAIPAGQGVAIAGSFEGSLAGLVAAGSRDAFLIVLDRTGRTLLTRRGGGIFNDKAQAVGVAADGSITFGAAIEGDAVFGPGERGQTTVTLAPAVGRAFLVRYFRP